MGGENIYEQFLAGSGHSPHEPAALRDSGAVVPWRRGLDGEVEVFWVRRAEALRFMGGWYSFPGGGVSRHDAEISVHVDARPDPDAGEPPSAELLACAARELFEEIGVLTATSPTSAAEEGTLVRGDPLAPRCRH